MPGDIDGKDSRQGGTEQATVYASRTSLRTTAEFAGIIGNSTNNQANRI